MAEHIAEGSPRRTMTLAMAERHVAEGRRRIAEQQALVWRLGHAGNDRLLALARDLLATMQTIQEISERYLIAEQAEAKAFEALRAPPTDESGRGTKGPA